MRTDEILKKCEEFIIGSELRSYDPFDALTNKFVDSFTHKNLFLRRVAIQLNSKSPVDLHWLGMKKMKHTKAISDLLWFYSVSEIPDKVEQVNKYFELLLELKCSDGYGWGLNFPYTSRFINAGEKTPNLYNTVNSGIAICHSLPYLNEQNKVNAEQAVSGIVKFIEDNLGYYTEGGKGWYSYYPGQKYPTYNVNALALYFLAAISKQGIIAEPDFVQSRIDALVNLLVEEQQPDGSWFYSRSANGTWVDGFHTGFIIESLAFTFKAGFQTEALEKCLRKGWDFYRAKMFTAQGYPKYFSDSDAFPIEAQNCAQAIQTISNVGEWLGWQEKDLLEKVIKYTVENLYDERGFFYHKKTKFLTYKTPYIRWSITPMMIALVYSQKFINKSLTMI